MKLLEETVRELKGEEIEDDVRANVNLRVDLRIDDVYVPDMNQRLMLYRTVAAARARGRDRPRARRDAATATARRRTRCSTWPPTGASACMADRLGLESVDREGRAVVLKFRPQAKLDPVRLVSLVRQRSDLTLVPPAALRLDLDVPPARSRGRPAGRERQRTGGVAGPRAASGRSAGGAPPSWWTSRARTGAVVPGFSKEEILRPAADDPRSPGGVFEQVGQLLRDLIE